MESCISSTGEKTQVYLRTEEPAVRLGISFQFQQDLDLGKGPALKSRLQSTSYNMWTNQLSAEFFMSKP